MAIGARKRRCRTRCIHAGAKPKRHQANRSANPTRKSPPQQTDTAEKLINAWLDEKKDAALKKLLMANSQLTDKDQLSQDAGLKALINSIQEMTITNRTDFFYSLSLIIVSYRYLSKSQYESVPTVGDTVKALKKELKEYIDLKESFFERVRNTRRDPNYYKVRHLSFDDEGRMTEI